VKILALITSIAFLSGCSVLDTVTHNEDTSIGVSASLVQINRSCPAKRVLCHLKAKPAEEVQTAPGEL